MTEPSDLVYPPPERVAELAAMPYREYLQSPEWREKRRIEICAASNHCQRCGFIGERYEFQLHHLTYARRGCEWPDDLEVLCVACHRAEHGFAS